MERMPFEGGGSDGEREEARVEVFGFGPMLFNISRAWELVKQNPRAAQPLDVGFWAQFYDIDGSSEPGTSFVTLANLNPGFAMTADLENPLLVASLVNHQGQDIPLLIDGMHRLYRAYAEQVRVLPSFVLSAEESASVRLDQYAALSLHWPSYDRFRELPDDRDRES